MRKVNRFFEGLGLGITGIVLLGLAVFITPLFSVILGWFSGWVASLVFGAQVASALSVIFNQPIAVSQIPFIFATVAALGSFFKSTLKIKKDKK